jgi:glutathione S-transferase
VWYSLRELRPIMSLLLYDNQVSGNCYKVRLILSLLGIEFERRELSVVDHSDRADVLGGLSPSLNVPTVVLEDGRPLGESNAILWYFADRTRYLPDDAYERAQVLQWLFFEQYKHEPGIAVVRFWLSISESPPPAPEIEARRSAGRAALEVMERHLADREYFVAERFTIADIALYPYTHVAPEGGFDLEPYPAVRAWLGRVAAQPGFVPITA